ncbi:hypothetical protein Clacol_010199 [Clathrus columnatus]|uniref:RING-type domain-containing protein n=1 Tax=Clathrus columnatus TaxID=1419009 RepID=A0AAV5AT54_9AGAM|nr:hypothetical protein Clacol_010199 [Clathrus columnatus]
MADSPLTGKALLELQLEEHNNCRNSSTGLLHRVDREIDSCNDPWAVNCYEGSSCSATHSALAVEHITGFNYSFQDYHYLQHQPEPLLTPEIPPSVVSQSTLGIYPNFSSLVSTTAQQRQSMVYTTGVNQPSRTPGVERAFRSEPNLSSASFASIVAWRQDSNTMEGDCRHEGESCTSFHTLVHGASSHTVHQTVSDTLDNASISENITSGPRVTSSVSDSGRSSPSEYMLSTNIGYSLTSRGNVCPDNNTRTNISTRSSGHRINSTIRVLRSQSRGSTSIRSRRISSSSRSLSPLNIGLALYPPTNDADNLPMLLSPSDRSERDRPPTPVTISETGSQTLSEDSRSRFIHPGTPIQMHLPELPSLLDATSTPSERSDGSEIWLITNDGPSGSGLSMESSFNGGGGIAQDDEDVFGCDKERAKELLDGLEMVEPHLVRRYEKVRGEDICIICRDTFLRQAQAQGTATTTTDHPEVKKEIPRDSEDLHALSALPFSPSVSDSSIHAFPCAHLFHTTCLFPWLSIKTTCPTCRLDIDPHSLTLRIRQWFGISDNQEPSYVNVDILGRRIPWHKPQAPNIEEWIQARETEMLHQQ